MGASVCYFCYAHEVFDEIPEPHLTSQKMVSSTEVRKLILLSVIDTNMLYLSMYIGHFTIEYVIL